jgi:hypothetical protein
MPTTRSWQASDLRKRVTATYWGSSGFDVSALLQTEMIYPGGPSPGLKLCSKMVRWLSRPRRYAVGSQSSLDSHRATAQTGLWVARAVALTYREQDAQLVLELESASYRAAHERKNWEQIWEQNSVKLAQISATARQP